MNDNSSRFVSVGHQTLINKSLRDQVMAMEVHESLTVSKQFLWTNNFRSKLLLALPLSNLSYPIPIV
jgi:hypothetical protein